MPNQDVIYGRVRKGAIKEYSEEELDNDEEIMLNK